MKEPIKLEINNEIVYLKKGFLGYHIVYPSSIDINKPIINKKPFKVNWENINWKHLIAGRSWWNLLGIVLITLLVLGCVYEYSIALKSLNECMNQSQIIKYMVPLT